MLFSLGLGVRPIYILVNACILEGTDGTRYGFSKNLFGVFDPPLAIDSSEVHELSWSAVGTFIMAFGISGSDQLTDIYDVYLTTPDNYTISLQWDSASSTYIGTDVNAANYLISDFVDGQQRCALIEIGLPEGKIVSYSFTNIERI